MIFRKIRHIPKFFFKLGVSKDFFYYLCVLKSGSMGNDTAF